MTCCKKMKCRWKSGWEAIPIPGGYQTVARGRERLQRNGQAPSGRGRGGLFMKAGGQPLQAQARALVPLWPVTPPPPPQSAAASTPAEPATPRTTLIPLLLHSLHCCTGIASSAQRTAEGSGGAASRQPRPQGVPA